RRHFLGVTGLGLATAVMARAMPELVGARSAFAGNIGDKVSLATWPAYHDPKNFEKFKALTGAEVQVSVFGANEEFLAKLQAGGAGWDIFVPTNYTISTHAQLGTIEPLDLKKVPNYDIAATTAAVTMAGAEIWIDYYAIPNSPPTREGGYALMSSLPHTAVNRG